MEPPTETPLPIENRSFEDSSLVSVFDTCNKITILPDGSVTPGPFKIEYQNGLFGRVYASVSAKPGEIAKALQLVKNNAPLPIMTYIVGLRESKKQIFTLKKASDNGMGGR